MVKWEWNNFVCCAHVYHIHTLARPDRGGGGDIEKHNSFIMGGGGVRGIRNLGGSRLCFFEIINYQGQSKN